MLPRLPDLLRWRMLDGSGWQFLLPRPRYERLACYDCLDGATLLLASALADEVRVVHHDARQLARLEAVAGEAGLGRIEFAAAAAPAGGVPDCDGALLHDPGARVLRRDHGAGPSLASLLADLSRAVRPDGFAYVGFGNRFGYDRVRGGAGGPKRLPAGAAAAALRHAGFTVPRAHAYLTHGTRLLEVLPASGYRSAKNSFLLSERARVLLLRGFGLRHLAPAYGLLAQRGAARTSWLDGILADPWVAGLAPGAAVRRWLVLNNGKVVLSLGRVDEDAGRVVLVLAPDSLGAENRRREASWLERLGRLPGVPRASWPTYHGEREIEGVPVFALSELPGVTIDQDTPLLPRLTAEAAGWLREFHVATAQPATLTAEAYATVVSPIFDAALAHYPALQDELGRLEAWVRGALVGQRVPLVFMHGDFKLENVVFDAGSCRLTGVIDWELARHPGPPLLDVLYLLSYNRVVRDSSDPWAAVAPAAGLSPWTAAERAVIDEYHAALDCRAVEPALSALFLVHHFGVRTLWDPRHEASRNKMRHLFSAPPAAARETAR